MSEPTKKDLIDFMWRQGDLEWKLWPQQVPIYQAIRRLNVACEEIVILCARQFGKCLAQGTDVLTPSGPRPIESLRPGDKVYGHNLDGSVSPCDVIANYAQGRKLVWDLGSRGRHVVSVTPEHRWLSRWKDNKNAPDRVAELTTNDVLNKRARKFARSFVDIPCGEYSEPHAYAIGALFGDGCAKQGRNRIAISSEDATIPNKVARILGAEHVFQSGQNFTWYISSAQKSTYDTRKHSVPIHCNHYDKWIKGRLSREKTCEWNIIDTWDRKSLVSLLAGMIDTDGSVILAPCGTLNIRFANTNDCLIDLFCRAFYKLYQQKPGICKTDRGCDAIEFTATVVSNMICVRALKELDSELVCPRKKWKPEYEKLNSRNTREDRIGLKKIGERYCETYDIQINNDSNLYVLANQGLITHNSHLGVLLALEDCLRFHEKCILIIGPTLKQTREIVTPRLREIAKDAPLGLIRPSKSESKWHIGTSELVMGGFDLSSSSQRGKTVQNIYIEEIVDSNPDDYVHSMRSDLGPALTHSDQGKMIFLTTLPPVPDHPFILETMTTAQLKGVLFKYSIDDNKQLTEAQYDACVHRSGGRHTTAFRREYLCEIVRDENIVVIPDFNPKIHVNDFAVPLYRDYYVTLDWGGIRDKTAALLISHDYYNDHDLVHEELFFPANTPLDKIMPSLEKWEEDHAIKGRFADLPGALQIELVHRYKYNITVPQKYDWQAGINQMNVRFSLGKVRIKPHCKFLITSCQSGTFNKQKTDFERTEALGHCDALAALMYGLRSIPRTNPFPKQYVPDNVFIRPKEEPLNQVAEAITGGVPFAPKGIKRFR